ncbi:uncharacterized protein LOC128492713 [Spea bombifrons]|uniref:uncharacterized protein LOC128492713 n=1 Tax=Spea bombifrons TaxID=233779 RepID=UPI0023497E8A|nr:uncharacterized protein LOC128492713 [Spea bombifrons]
MDNDIEMPLSSMREAAQTKGVSWLKDRFQDTVVADEGPATDKPRPRTSSRPRRPPARLSPELDTIPPSPAAASSALPSRSRVPQGSSKRPSGGSRSASASVANSQRRPARRASPSPSRSIVSLAASSGDDNWLDLDDPAPPPSRRRRAPAARGDEPSDAVRETQRSPSPSSFPVPAISSRTAPSKRSRSAHARGSSCDVGDEATSRRDDVSRLTSVAPFGQEMAAVRSSIVSSGGSAVPSIGCVTATGPGAGSGVHPRSTMATFSGGRAGCGRVGSRCPYVDLESGRHHVMKQIDKSLASATWASYRAVWKDWVGFLDEAGNPCSEGDQLVVLLWYLGSEFARGTSVAGMDRRLAALAFYFKLQGARDITKEFLVGKAMKGYRRGGYRPDSRRPVTFRLLERICGCLCSICSSGFKVGLFHLSFLLAFFGAFRIGELVAANTKSQGGLQLRDVCLGTEMVEILIRRSKTDKNGKGFKVQLLSFPGSDLCPVGSLRAYLAIRPEGEGSLLRHADNTSLSRFQFVAVFRKCLGSLGLAPSEFESHSFRIRAATQAARWGLGDAIIKRIGRWESGRFRRYIRPNLI